MHTSPANHVHLNDHLEKLHCKCKKITHLEGCEGNGEIVEEERGIEIKMVEEERGSKYKLPLKHVLNHDWSKIHCKSCNCVKIIPAAVNESGREMEGEKREMTK